MVAIAVLVSVNGRTYREKKDAFPKFIRINTSVDGARDPFCLLCLSRTEGTKFICTEIKADGLLVQKLGVPWPSLRLVFNRTRVQAQA